VPLSVRIVLGVVLGCIAALVLGRHAVPMGDVGMLVIQLLKALAAPLLFFAILDAFTTHDIPPKKGVRLVVISAINAVVATAIGLTVATLLGGGRGWRGQLDSLRAQVAAHAPHTAQPATHAAENVPTLDPIANLTSFVPTSIVDPFVKNAIIPIVLIAVTAGFALRSVRRKQPALASGLDAIAQFVRTGLAVCTQMLEWIIQLIPFAVFAVVASVVAKTGLGIFTILAPFLGTIVLGLAIHAIVYYSLLLRLVSRRNPIEFFRHAGEAIITALSCGSSLATLPVTLRVLDRKLKVSADSARLAACVGTNLNHDGIILYEASAALFVAQALGFGLTLGQKLSVALASVMAGVGIAGVPEAGLVTLPLVLSAAGLPEGVVATVIPLLVPLDWLIGRCRAATNVISDMTVATILDRTTASEPAAAVERAA
jgi:Na+/H+-dicarboxylate symporter